MGIQEIAEKILDRQVRAGYLPQENADEVRKLSEETNNSIINILLEKNYISVIDLQNSLEDITGVPCFDPAYVDWTKDRIEEICQIFPPKFLKENKIFFREKKNNYVTIGMLDPDDEKLIDLIQCYTGCKVTPNISFETGLKATYDQYLNETYLSQDILDHGPNQPRQ